MTTKDSIILDASFHCKQVNLFFPLKKDWCFINKQHSVISFLDWESEHLVIHIGMGPGQKFLTRVGSDQPLLVWV